MYCEWYGVCDFVGLSAVEVCADYVGVNVFHVCLNVGVVYGVGVCVNVWVVVCCLLCCDVVGGWGVVIFVLSVMCVLGGVPLWVVCVFRRVDVFCSLYLMLLVTIWWKCTRVWVLLWFCMLRGSFPFVSPMLLM